MTGSATALAAEAVELAEVDPQRATAAAGAALRLARAERDRAAASLAERALGLAAREAYDMDAAVAHLRRAVHIAQRAGLELPAAQARVHLSGTLALRGDGAGALREADRAAAVLDGPDLALLQAQRAFILQMQGRLAEALDGYQRVLPAFRRAGDRQREAKALHNRGLIHHHLGALRAAEADLVRAERLWVETGQERSAADARQNLGCVLVRQGDLPGALAWFDRADEFFAARGMVDPVGLRDRCEALLAARLVAEARDSAEQAVRELAGRGMAPFLAEARLLLSEAALLDGDLDAARAAAEQARTAFRRQGRPSFAALARYALVRVDWASGARSPAALAEARRTAAALASAGWAVPALDARLLAAHLAVDLGRLPAARRELAGTAVARRRGPVELRSRAWHAEALLRLAGGDRAGAESALRAGLRVLERYRAALGATELRAHASAHAGELARLGLGLALADGDPGRVLRWAERWRANALRLRPVRPPGDVELATGLAELRRVAAEIGEAIAAGHDADRLLARQAGLEEAVRRRARQARTPGLYRATPEPGLGPLQAALADRALVELAELDGRLHAVVLAGGRASLHGLGPSAEVAAEQAGLRFALRRLAAGHGGPASAAAAATAVDLAARRLDELLLAPLAASTGDRALVIVPTGGLHALPWAALPSCAGRPVAVAPSAALWHQAAAGSPAPADGRVVLVVGPGLPEAAAEVAELRRRYPEAACLEGGAASVASVAAALDGAGLAHVAAHGHFRTDNPLFSSLELADGPLTVYDLEAMARAPRRLVLAACDAGLSEVAAGDELMGLAAALFSLGMGTLVAAVTPVPDAATRPLMLALHDGLRAGTAPAAALAATQAGALGRDGPGAWAAAASFVCFGAGD
jgi:tetratricopeptide (TPR) repeat protein